MKRLYLKLYVAFLGVLLAIVLVTGVVNFLVTGRVFALFRGGGPRMAHHLVRMIDRPDPLQRILDEMHDELGMDVAVFGPGGEILASAGAPLPPIEPDRLERGRRGPEWIGRGMLAAPARRVPGAVLVARLPIPEGAVRAFRIRTALLLAGALLISLALVYPLSRSITRPLEKLTAAVRAYGQGDLSRRSGLGALDDEVGQLARSFDEMADRIQAARRAEKELLANVSHELRTPLARMKVVLELIEPQDDSVRRRLSSLNEEVDELDRLIGDVLTATRLDLSALPLRKVRLRVADVVAKAIARAAALQPELQTEFRIEPDLQVEADEALLGRALDNLLDNARKYGNGTPVDLEGRREDGFAMIAVRDHGPGIPEAELGKVFDSFFRGEGMRGTTSGYGLGLALAKRVALAHGGTASAGNAEGGGARIELRLPAA